VGASATAEEVKAALFASVLDASALLAFLLDERGAERVERALDAGACISTLNWAETLARLVEGGGPVEATVTRALPATSSGPLVLLPFDDEQARETARLRPVTRALGLSLADRACLALGRLHRLPVLTADRAWRSLHLSVKIEVIR
jgi:ribonuclease VapC